MNYNLIRMLEKYSKEKDHVFVRKQRRIRKKNKKGEVEPEGEGKVFEILMYMKADMIVK
jgi:hypothetical protein